MTTLFDNNAMAYPTITIPQPELCAILAPINWYACAYIILLLFSFPILFFISAPYGKLKQSTWTFDVTPRVAWFIMEAPAWMSHLTLTFLLLPSLFTNVQIAYKQYGIPIVNNIDNTTITTTMTANNIIDNVLSNDIIVPPQINLYIIITLISIILYNGHYIYRSVIYPRLTKSIKKNDLLPVLLACIFNFCNGFAQGYDTYCSLPQDVTYLSYPLYVLGHIGFCLCWYGCFWSDMYLISLRGNNTKNTSSYNNNNNDNNNNNNNDKSHYTIPTEGLFKITYCANYFSEFFSWVFFAIITIQSPTRWLFVLLTFSNLFPRAYQYRQFYLNLANANNSKKDHSKKDQ